tara:strand:+ start:1491 stop:2006 length:516 start_codon:yes stop_codon:yes gene_type:complete
MALKTYRYKFSELFKNELMEFSRIHKYDEPAAFKDNWDIWCKDNKSIIDNEIAILKNNGYTGNALDKMYKSVRYYFKNKSDVKKEVKQRRQYLGLSPEFREAVDTHIQNIALRRELKPSIGFVDFMDQVIYSQLIRSEKLRLESYNFTKEDINNKFKKSYKNRYFLEQKKR